MNETLKSPRKRSAMDAVCIGASMMALMAASVLVPNSTPTTASSHREAPLISQDQFADVTDVYAFVSPDATSTATLIANWIPFEDATGGPNFYHYDPLVHYYLKVDRDGDGKEDISWKWTFSPLTIKNTGTFLYNTFAITNINSSSFNIIQTYTVTQITGPTDAVTSSPSISAVVILTNVVQPPNFVGPRSFALPTSSSSTDNYETIAKQAIYTTSNGYKVFTGQRDDPFFVDIGSIFDLGALRPFNTLHLIKQPTAVGIDSVGGFNIHTTAIQVPKTVLAPTCTNAQADKSCVIGVWATSERPTLITRGFASVTGNNTYVQVARLGNPLINEAVLPLALKDAFNSLEPKDDTGLAAGTFAGPGAAALFQAAVFTPELQTLLPVLYPGVFTPGTNLPTTPRMDLFTIFLTGIPGVTQQTNSGNPFVDPTKTASEMLRLNLAIPANTAGVCKGKIFGALDGDFAGFPNGRRLEDDVTDIALRAVAGGYGKVLSDALGLPNFSPGNILSDGVQANDKPCLASFPYIPSPSSGYNDLHPYPTGIWMPIVAKGV